MAINVTANVTPIAVIQVKPGIGERVWHLPFIRAIAAAAPERQVTFFAPQSFFITNPGIDQEHFHDHPIDWLRALMAAMNVPLPSTEPDLQLSTRVLTTVGEKFA